ncbi:MAG: ParB/RepB/Spo0J family partition protein [Planctomycetia bacterium]|nr:ParB/RepB/Spo0J family partition protein [Planctomycetia bacterium]
MSSNRLGKGLEALIIPRNDTISSGTLKINVNSISPNPHQPRQQFDKEALQELVASIKRKGILTPITVRNDAGNYILIAGERRLRAAKLAGLSEIPAYIIDVENDAEMMEMALIENIQRENLNPIEEAEAYAVLNSKYGLSQDAVARSVGKKRVTVTNSLRLLNLPPEIKESIKMGEISAGHGRAILMMKTTRAMVKLWQLVVKKNLSVRGAETLAKANISSKSGFKTRKKEIDPRIKHLEDELISALGTKVKLTYQKGSGKIIVNYFSDDDFERIFSLLTGNKNS